MRRLLASLLLIACCPNTALAYEEATHEVLTDAAVSNSVLQTDPTLLEDFGLTSANIFSNVKKQKRSVFELIRDGANFEDNFPNELQVRWHFYNPVTGNGASTLVVPAQISSPRWATMPRDADSRQKFSYWDARSYLFDALTKRDAVDRETAFGLSFQTLGNVVHHLQDMAQPQHVRNDAHCKYIICAIGFAYAPSLYEAWTDSVRTTLPRNPATAGYDINGSAFTSTFDKPETLWHTEAPGMGGVSIGKGLAEFTNRNFVSAGTNYWWSFGELQRNFNFPLPDPTGVDLVREQVSVLNMRTGETLSGEMWFVPNVIQDNFRGTTDVNLRGSTYSAFDADLTRIGVRPLMSLNRLNFEAAYPYLMPRAVAYSAGLINYFFRARIDLKKDDQDPSKFRIANLTRELMSGRFALYYDAQDGKRYPVAVDQNDPNRDPNDANAWRLLISPRDPANPSANLSDPISFVAPVDDGSPTAPKAANEYMLVFRGNLGEEREDPGLGIPGAVGAKMVALPYNSVLYLLGADAFNNQRIFLRADKTGTRVVGPDEFHPLRNLVLAPFQSFLPKAYTHRQATFKETAFGLSYETVAITTGQHLQFPFLIVPTGFVKNSANGAFEAFNSNGAAWKAKSPDPRIGEFLLRAVIPENNFNIGQLEYSRTFADPDGNPQTVNGSVALPSLAGTGLGYGGFPQGAFYISPDGLSVKGFATITGTVSGNTVTGTRNEFEMRIALGEVPSVSLVPIGSRLESTTTTQNTPETSTVVGQISISDTCPDPSGVPVTDTKDVVHTEFSIRSDGQFSQLNYIGWVNNAFRTYTVTSNTVNLASSTVTAGTAGTCNMVNIVSQGKQVNIATVDGASQFDVGNLPITIRSNDAGLGSTLPNTTWDFSYAGPRPSPPISFKSTAFTPPIKNDPSVNIGLTERAEDAIYQLGTLNGIPKVFFRDNDIGTRGYVADASPIGEVFFAATDLSVVVHEPKRGPTIVIPKNVVRLLGVVWM